MTTYTLPPKTPGLPLRFIDGVRQAIADTRNNYVRTQSKTAPAEFLAGYKVGLAVEITRRVPCTTL